MTAESEGRPRGILLYSRLLLSVVAFLVFVAGVQLYVLSGQTADWFAWTIAAPLSAAMIGAGFWSTLVPAVAALRQPYWQEFRVSLPGALTATTLALAATVLHLDKFHLARPELVPRLAAVIWLLVYVVVPPAFLLAYLIQHRMPGRDTAPRRDMPVWLRGLLLAQAAAALLTGLALFIAPAGVAPAWGWALTPLTARMIGAWLCAYGVLATVAVRENDLRRVRGLMAGLVVFGALQLLALARFAGSVDWAKPATWAYTVFLVSVVIVNAAGMRTRAN